jgi:hypothetical protein
VPQPRYVFGEVRQTSLEHALAEEASDSTPFEWNVWTARPQEEHRRGARVAGPAVLQVVAQQPQRARIERECQRRARLPVDRVKAAARPPRSGAARSRRSDAGCRGLSSRRGWCGRSIVEVAARAARAALAAAARRDKCCRVPSRSRRSRTRPPSSNDPDRCRDG